MVRNNEDRFGPRNSGGDEVPGADIESILDFVTPTEFVTLPSNGRGYPAGHRLHEQKEIEIKYMTAKHEDILTSRTLLKSGVALDRLISELICDKNIRGKDLLMGDRNAIIIAARASGYGMDYNTKVTCPACGTVCKRTFDLSTPTVYHGDDWEDFNIKLLDNGNYLITLPITNFEVEVRLLKGTDEAKIIKLLQNKSKDTSVITSQMRMYIVSINGHNQPNVIKHFVENVPSGQSRYLRDAYERITPSVKITRHFECDSCEHEQEMEVSLGADFFWPDR